MKTALLFPGQGAQSVGMGKDLADSFPEAADIFEKANDTVGYDLKTFCFEDPQEKLNSTEFSQPAIFTVSAAILEVLKNHSATANLKPDVTAGLSLGEYTALYAAGIVNFEDGLRLTQFRGRAMQAAADKTEGAMVSIIGLDEEKVNALCAQAGQGELLAGVNYNCPGQIVISGTKAACARAVELAPEYEAIKAIPLAVAGAFHTEMMNEAADGLADALSKTDISEPGDIKIIANINADYYTDSQEIVAGLKKQLTSPIYWQKCMERLLADGIENFYEIGPGRVLTGLMKRINRKQKVINFSDTASLKNLV
ncbi:MAG: ACP S-malonyltransferase [Sedimentisphaerales bacterium]|nr:ACP S-malonyltransferase [Sedimentisphaerales bacterium]